MSTFAAELRALAERLDLPQTVRADIVRELDADLRGLADALEARGIPREEARRRAVETLLPTPEALARLVSHHRPLYRRLVDRFSDPIRHRLERALFGTALLAFALAGGAALGGLDLFADPAAFTPLLLGLGLATGGLVLWKLFQLHVRKEHRTERLRRGLGWLPAIAVAATVGSLLGLTWDLYGTAGRLIEAGPEADPRAILLAWLRRDTAMASLGLVVGALALGCWLWLAAGVARVARAELEIERDIGPDADESESAASMEPQPRGEAR